ncbi:exported hypothetical protein [uncultured Dysgonomonas sp.]|uniref:RHS repeat-associated core domain-containing protein n=2 Tax=uncultured Dysgonomonas sp. TaxID=206096 RepID=A0A212ITP3_9BACT|nr:exported hypothetical protein [uncultured Dysgonomonas sp.]
MNLQAATVMATAPFSTQATDTKTTDYVGNKVYENGTLKRILIDGGYIEGTTYHFYLTDHLGNNRVVAKADGTVIQKNHYYPFGMAFAENTTAEQGVQPYKYNGKELDQMHGLNMYDYSARFYEPGIGRFSAVDPLAEKYPWISPYVYCNNNPIKYIDPDGLDWVMRGVGGNAYYYYDKDVKSWDDIKNKYGDGKIAGNVMLIKEGQQVKISGKDGNSMVYTFSNENKSFTDASGNALGEMDIMSGKGFAVIGTGDKNVDGATLHNNLFGTSTTGGNNPRTNDKTEEYFGYLPFQTNQDNYSLKHDIGYNAKGANGAASAFTNIEVLPDDYKLAGRNALNALNPSISERERWRSIGTAAAFGAISVVKTIASPVLSPFVYKKKGTK